MTTLDESLVDQLYYPEFIQLEVEFADTLPPLVLAEHLGCCLHESGLGEILGYTATGMRGEITAGTQRGLQKLLTSMGPVEAHHFAVVTKDESRFSATRGMGGRQAWSIHGNYPPETVPQSEWVEAMARLSVELARLPGFGFVVLARHETSWAQFPPFPPLARYNHVVSVTDQEVAEAYEDPESFWKCWARVERIGDARVCIRALDKLDVEDWLSETFESTMHLARIAKPNLTIYRTPGAVRPAFAPWWEYGDIIADERAGYPALSFVGYDLPARTVEYAGFCTDTDIAKGGPDPRHVLIREIHEIRALVKARKDREGRPVDTVRVVFAEEWMARRERRPLLDVGARVYFMDRKTGKDIEVTE